MISPGSLFAGYRIERVLGSGGMGTVYLGRGVDLPRREAIKVLPSDLSRDPDFRARFLREADIAASLDHPNVVSVYGRGEFEGQLWIAMQFIDGADADEALVAGAMTPARAVHVIAEVAKALDYAHQHHVVHRDVKPANFLLSGPAGPQERALLSDFGIARALDDSKLTATGSLTATIAYAAPEVLAGDHFDGRADMYSLGCTLFRLLTGHPPYAATNGIAAVVAAHLTAPPPRLSSRVSGFSPRLDAVIATAMAKDPGQRFSSAREFASAAVDALDGATRVASRPVPVFAVAPYVAQTPAGPNYGQPQGFQGWQSQKHAPAAPPVSPKRRGAWMVLAAAMILAIVLAAVWATLLVRSRHTAEPAPSPTAPTAVSAGGLDGLLLTSDQAAEIIGAPKLFVVKDISHLVDEASAVHLLGKDADCIGAYLPAEEYAYRTSKWKAVRRKDLSAGDGPDVYVISQAVVVFPDAAAARQALATQVPQWSACVGRTVTATVEGLAPQQSAFGPVTNSGGIVSMIQIRNGIAGSGCQRAMTARENAMVDVDACRFNLASEGIGVLKAIAARINP